MSEDSPRGWFEHALLTGDMNVIDRAARNLGQLALDDALRVLVVMAAQQDARSERASQRWGRWLIYERRLNPDDSRRALTLVELIPEAPEVIADVLRKYCGG